MKRRRAGMLALLIVCGLVLAGCGKKEKPLKEFRSQYLDYFDTFTTVTIYAEDEETFDRYKGVIEDRLKRYHELFDIYHNYEGISNLKAINDSAGMAPVQTDPEVLELLKRAQNMYEETDGRVNVAMGSVLGLWHDCREEASKDPEHARIPDRKELEEAAEHMDIRTMELNAEQNTVYLPDPQMQLDAGAVAKGYAAQKICEALREAGATSVLLSIGGNVQTIGQRGDGKSWRVGIQNPDTGSQQSYLHAVKLQDMALVTSGSYQRFYEADGVRYHHIIDPDTLMPKRLYDGVTILCKDGSAADALSTAVFNMEPEEGQNLIESLEDTEAIWIFPGGSEMTSSGFSQYIDD